MLTQPGPLNPVARIAALTRRFQALSPHRPVKGLTRFGNLIDHIGRYQGAVRLPDDVWMTLDSRQPTERWLMFAGNYQPGLTAFLKAQTPRGGICLDVGANLGFYALHFARWVGPEGRVVAAEANPALAQRIAQDAVLNGFEHLRVVDRPIHAREETMTFYISAAPGKSSLLADHVPDPVRTVTTTSTTIDALAAEEGWSRLDVIKIDIEGNDCNALLGSHETLARFGPVLAFEYWTTTPPDVAGPTFDLLARLGYHWQALQPGGHSIPFDWRQPGPHKHVDITAQPRPTRPG